MKRVPFEKNKRERERDSQDSLFKESFSKSTRDDQSALELRSIKMAIRERERERERETERDREIDRDRDREQEEPLIAIKQPGIKQSNLMVYLCIAIHFDVVKWYTFIYICRLR